MSRESKRKGFIMVNNNAVINLCNTIEDYGFFPVLVNGRLIWNMAVFPKTDKKEVFFQAVQELNIPVTTASKRGPRINQVKECFVFDKSKFEKITAMIEHSVQTR